MILLAMILMRVSLKEYHFDHFYYLRKQVVEVECKKRETFISYHFEGKKRNGRRGEKHGSKNKKLYERENHQ